MTYMVKNSAKLNLVLSHPDDIDTGTWTQEQYLGELRRTYGDMDISVQHLLDLISGPITNWPVFQVRTLPTWVSKSGKFVLMGDAAHAMAFYLSMGVSLAVEDAAALTSCLERHTSHPDKVSLASTIKAFEEIRKPRAKLVRDASLNAGNMLHVPPGNERDARDTAARRDGVLESGVDGIASSEFLVKSSRYGITDKNIRDWCYGYDVVEAVRKMDTNELSLP